MRKLFQINCDSNWGSIGRITEQIGLMAKEEGWESYIAYGRDENPSLLSKIKIGNTLSVYEHYIENKLWDNEGLASRIATKNLIKRIERINPDLIHLHNIHDHYINYKILFNYLAQIDIPIVWTQHDCWAFTGGCMYYSMTNCDKWKTECINCPRKRSVIDGTNRQYKKKREMFLGVKRLTLVPVSEWLSDQLSYSFLSKCDKRTILNGIDVNVFHPIEKSNIRDVYGLGDSILLLAAATTWTERKGLRDYVSLAQHLPNNIKIVLVGISTDQKKLLPENVIGLHRTQDINEMAQLYSEAAIVLNLSYEETFGLTTAEGFACGTPSVVYNCTASPELITEETGRIVEPGDINGVFRAITELSGIDKDTMKKACRQRAEKYYDKKNSFRKYIQLYNDLLEGK